MSRGFSNPLPYHGTAERQRRSPFFRVTFSDSAVSLTDRWNRGESVGLLASPTEFSGDVVGRWSSAEYYCKYYPKHYRLALIPALFGIWQSAVHERGLAHIAALGLS